MSFKSKPCWVAIYEARVKCRYWTTYCYCGAILCTLIVTASSNVCWVLFFFQPRNASPVFLIACMLRGLFIPLFLLCNVQPRTHHVSVPFKSDAVPIVLNCLFGLSNGYMGTLSMMHAPRLVNITIIVQWFLFELAVEIILSECLKCT